MSKHTPGPWLAATEENPQDEGWFVKSSSRPYVASVHWGAKPDETESNACLIAAAPDLLDVAQRSAAALVSAGVESNANSDNPLEGLLHMTLAAIAKAKGETP